MINILDWINRGVQFHSQGNLQAAAQICRQILEIDLENHDAIGTVFNEISGIKLFRQPLNPISITVASTLIERPFSIFCLLEKRTGISLILSHVSNRICVIVFCRVVK